MARDKAAKPQLALETRSIQVAMLDQVKALVGAKGLAQQQMDIMEVPVLAELEERVATVEMVGREEMDFKMDSMGMRSVEAEVELDKSELEVA
jgi:hypothetical protein